MRVPGSGRRKFRIRQACRIIQCFVTFVPGAGLLAFAPKPPALPTEGRGFAEDFLSPLSELDCAALPLRCFAFVPAFPAAA